MQIVEVIDKGSGYTAGDVLTLNNAVELGGAGNGFQVTVNTIVNSLGDGNGTQGVELVKTPNFTDIPAVQRHTEDGRYAWGEQYSTNDIVRALTISLVEYCSPQAYRPSSVWRCTAGMSVKLGVFTNSTPCVPFPSPREFTIVFTVT